VAALRERGGRMSIAKLLVLVLGLAAVALAVKVALTSTLGNEASVTEPMRQLDHTRARARELEHDLQKNADRADVAR
jgi:hypothetical protein